MQHIFRSHHNGGCQINPQVIRAIYISISMSVLIWLITGQSLEKRQQARSRNDSPAHPLPNQVQSMIGYTQRSSPDSWQKNSTHAVIMLCVVRWVLWMGLSEMCKLIKKEICWHLIKYNTENIRRLSLAWIECERIYLYYRQRLNEKKLTCLRVQTTRVPWYRY